MSKRGNFRSNRGRLTPDTNFTFGGIGLPERGSTRHVLGVRRRGHDLPPETGRCKKMRNQRDRKISCESKTVIRRRPIPRTVHYHWTPRPKPQSSLRYETILDGAVRLYPDGREVCQDNAAGYREYKRRVQVMVQRQKYRCCLCKRRLSQSEATFEHQRRRGMHAAFRDDRIVKGWSGVERGSALGVQLREGVSRNFTCSGV